MCQEDLLYVCMCVCVWQNGSTRDLLWPGVPAPGFDPAPLLHWSHSGRFLRIYQSQQTHSKFATDKSMETDMYTLSALKIT